MPDILKPRNLIETGDTVCIPDVDWHSPQPLLEEEPEMDGVFREAEFEEITTEGEEPVPPPEEEPEPEPEPEVPPEPPTRAELAAMFHEELSELCQSEAQRAYAEATAQKRGELKECLARVDRQLAQMQEMQNQYIVRYAEELKFLAIDIAEKMILTRVEEDDMVLRKLVMQTVGAIKNNNWLDVELSEGLVDLVETMKRELEKPEYHGRAAVTASAVALDTIRVSSEEGTVVASISAQSQNLRELFGKS